MSICSKHQKKDPNCSACNVDIEPLFEGFVEPELETCSSCNFVYYAHCDTCPLCQKENTRD